MNLHQNSLDSENNNGFRLWFYPVTAGIAIVASAFHFWPLDDSAVWQAANIPNLCCAATFVYTIVLLTRNRSFSRPLYLIPHVSILAYLAINVLSMSFADNLARPLSYNIKLCLVFAGGLCLFENTFFQTKLKSFYIIIAIPVFLSICACLYTKINLDPGQSGFFATPFKYGTYIAILLPLAGIYMMASKPILLRIMGILLTAGGVFSLGTAGAILGVFSGLIIALILAFEKTARICTLICTLLSIGAFWLSNTIFNNSITKDFALRENDSNHLKQRYIEWQAEINLLEDRGITGTGAGCINDYRSNYYYRLPKLNTLKPFDQNGFLAIGVETGLPGLAAFIWILIHYGWMNVNNWQNSRKNTSSHVRAIALANIAAFISAIIANLFSSFHYNGVLLIFVFLLSLISSCNRLYGDDQREA